MGIVNVLQKQIAMHTTLITHRATVVLGQQTKSIAYFQYPDGHIGVEIVSLSKGTETPKTASFYLPVLSQRHPTVQQTLQDLLSLIETANCRTNTQQQMQLFHAMSKIGLTLNQFFGNPRVLADKIPIRLDVIFPLFEYHVRDRSDGQYPTIYNCGRPTGYTFSPEQQSRVDRIASELMLFIQAPRVPTINPVERTQGTLQRSVCDPKVDVPAPFERWLEDIAPLLEAERLTDRYSVYQSLQFLMAKNRINPGGGESASYALNERYATHAVSTETWTRSLAQAMVLVADADLPLFQALNYPGWEPTAEAILKDRLGYSEASFKAYFESLASQATDSVAIPPTLRDNPVDYLIKHVNRAMGATYVSMTSDQQILVKGLVYCHKVQLKDFILAFTAGAKGREETSRHAGQCGAEYAKRAKAAIETYATFSATPTTFSDLILGMIRETRKAVLREILVGDSTSENTTFETQIIEIEALENPNLDLLQSSLDRGHQAGRFLQKMTLERCASELHQIFAQATDDQKTQWAQLSDNQSSVSIESLAQSPQAFYPLFAELGLCHAVRKPLPSDTNEQRRIVAELAITILFLRPEAYRSVTSELDVSLPMHRKAFDLVKKRLLEECLHLTGLSGWHKAFLEHIIQTDGCHLSLSEIQSYFPNYMARFNDVSSVFACHLVACCRSDICQRHLYRDQPISSMRDDMFALYTAAKNLLDSSFIATERLEIRRALRHKVGLYAEELVYHLYAQNPDALTPDLIQAERADILGQKIPNISSLQKLYLLVGQWITSEFIYQEQQAILDRGVFHSDAYLLITGLYALKPDLITPDSIRYYQKSCPWLLPYDISELACALYLLNPSMLTLDRIREDRAVLSSLPIEYQCERVHALYAIRKDLLTSDLIWVQHHAIRNCDTLTDLRKAVLVSVLFAITPDLVTGELVQTERALILDGRLTDEEKADYLKKLYCLPTILNDSVVIRQEIDAIYKSQLTFLYSIELCTSLHARMSVLLTSVILSAIPSVVQTEASITALTSGLTDFDCSIHIDTTDLLEKCVKIRPTLKEDLVYDTLKRSHRLFRDSGRPYGPYTELRKFRQHLLHQDASLADKIGSLSELRSMLPNLRTKEMLVDEYLDILDSDLMVSEKITLLIACHERLEHLPLTLIAFVSDIKDASLDVPHKEMLLRDLCVRIRPDHLNNLIKNIYLCPSNDSFSYVWLIDFMTPQMICHHVSHPHGASWLWSLLNESWDFVKDHPVITELRRYNRTGLTLTENALHTIIPMDIRDDLKSVLKVYIGHLISKNPESAKAKLIANFLV